MGDTGLPGGAGLPPTATGSSSASPGDPTQGPSGIPQGFNGASVGASLGPQIGLQRDKMGGMGSSPPPGAGDPIGDLIKAVVQALTGGAGGGGAPPQLPPMGGMPGK